MKHGSQDSLRSADGDDVDRDSLVYLQLVQSLIYEIKHLLWVFKVNDRGQMDVFRIIVAARDSEGRPWKARADLPL